MTSYYIQTNIICLLLLVGLSTLLHRKKGAIPAQQLALTRLIMFTIAICVSDIFAWTCNGKTFSGARAVVEASNIIYYAAITWTCFAWVNYVNIFTHSLEYNHKKNMLISAIPLFATTVLLLLNPVLHFFFSIDGDNVYARGSGVILHWIVSWGYLIYATGMTFHRIRISKTKLERKQFYPLLSFAVLPAVGAACQMAFYGMTAVQCGITLSVIMIAFGNLREQISSDTLTGLNNRKALENYLSNRLQRQGQNFSVIFCDIDHFKTINDTLGHAKGDIMLKRTADVLRRACGSSPEPLFLCRYGGDEFVICGVDIAETTLDAFYGNLREEMSAMNARYPGDHPLDISAGRASAFCDSEDDVEKLIHLADTSMYEMKNGKN